MKPASGDSDPLPSSKKSLRQREHAAGDREAAASVREAAASLREDAAALREEVQRAVADLQSDVEVRTADLREANQNLIIAALLAQDLKEAAQKTQRRQEEFLAMLAHELRNPLAPIRTAAELLAQLDTREPALTLIREVIQRQVEHMARLLDDLLDASRVTSGKVNLQRRPTAVGEFIDLAVKTCCGVIDAQHQLLTLDLPLEPLYVDGDQVRLVQVIGNLLHNAAKYTQKGGTIAVSARPDGDTVVIRVRDNGMGISAEALPHIFELFTQEDRSLSRSQSGLGIGLTVVRNMVALHGGTVEASSGGLGRGAEFTVTLPRTRHAPEAALASPEKVAAAPARILLVDDNADANVLLSMLLSLSGHEVEMAADGPGALEAFARVQPQVVVCDIGLPGMNGYEVAERMRALAGEAKVLLIALTGYDGLEYRARSMAAGFDHHLTKPVDVDVILRLIAGWAALKR